MFSQLAIISISFVNCKILCCVPFSSEVRILRWELHHIWVHHISLTKRENKDGHLFVELLLLALVAHISRWHKRVSRWKLHYVVAVSNVLRNSEMSNLKFKFQEVFLMMEPSVMSENVGCWVLAIVATLAVSTIISVTWTRTACLISCLIIFTKNTVRFHLLGNCWLMFSKEWQTENSEHIIFLTWNIPSFRYLGICLSMKKLFLILCETSDLHNSVVVSYPSLFSNCPFI